MMIFNAVKYLLFFPSIIYITGIQNCQKKSPDSRKLPSVSLECSVLVWHGRPTHLEVSIMTPLSVNDSTMLR